MKWNFISGSGGSLSEETNNSIQYLATNHVISGELFNRNKFKIYLKTTRDHHKWKRKSFPTAVSILTATAQPLTKRGRIE